MARKNVNVNKNPGYSISYKPPGYQGAHTANRQAMPWAVAAHDAPRSSVGIVGRAVAAIF